MSYFHNNLPSLDKQIGDVVRSYIDTLTKPPGSLGRLEAIAIELVRLGEGSSAAVAFPILQSATSMLKEMVTFQSAGISNKE